MQIHSPHCHSPHCHSPHCHSPIEVVGDDFSDISCPSCGSHFNLISGEATKALRSDQVRTIGHFEQLDQVGVGAFGSVWKVWKVWKARA